jgi:uncharacterized protein involved in exopolysaccharide biosynthesis/Mrp family chromosome partitioning ATPase
MNESHNGTPPAPMIKLADILYVMFRHKWKILIISALGILATCLVPFLTPRLYQSEAKLLIKYVLESKSGHEIASSEAQVKSIDSQGESIISTELQLLSSLDLARDVAAVVGPDKVLAQLGGGSNVESAAGVIRANLITDVPKGSTVIRIVFQHPDRALVQPILKQIIDSYLKMHAAIHLPGGELDDFLTRETDDYHNNLQKDEEALRQAKEKAGIISLEDSKKGYTERISKIQADILATEAQLEERRTVAAEIAKLLHTKPVSLTNEMAGSNTVAVSAEKEAEYKSVCRRLESLRKTEDQLLTYLMPGSRGVKDVQAQIATNENIKVELEAKNPGLLAVKTWERPAGGPDATGGQRPEFDLSREAANETGLRAKLRVLTAQLESLRKEATNLDVADREISDWQRKLTFDEARYKAFFDSRDRALIDERLSAGRISNIKPIQEASPPFLASTKLVKMMALVLFGCIGGALVLAFLIEFYLDPSLKRPAEVEAKLGVPLFMSIPLMRQNGNGLALPAVRKLPLLPEKNNGAPTGDGGAPPANNGQHSAEGALAAAPGSALDAGVALWDSRHAMRPFSDALRDRLINFFEAKNMTHKPKLVAVTSCREGSGVSTIAAGLAASLSETGDGNVLLVDMNQQEGAAHQFYHGDLASLDDALEAGKRDNAMVQDNLYVVAECSTGDNLPRALPKRFKNIVPRLKASDFDYIIFDLPPVTPISMTPRLSRFMDVVLMVIESEKTDKDVLKRGITLLHESQRNIGTVLNKRRSYVPKWLQQEF